MSYEEKTIYKDIKTLQYAKAGLVCDMQTVISEILSTDSDEDISQLLDALKIDIEVVIDAIERLRDSKRYFSSKKQEAEKNE